MKCVIFAAASPDQREYPRFAKRMEAAGLCCLASAPWRWKDETMSSCGPGGRSSKPWDLEGRTSSLWDLGGRTLSLWDLGGRTLSLWNPGGRTSSFWSPGGLKEETGAGWPCPKDELLVITDDEGTAKICEERNIACVGYSPAGAETSYFPHVRLVHACLEDVDAGELERFWRRFRGLPVSIACTERLWIRESVPEDFDAVYRMEQQAAGQREEQGSERKKREETFLAYIKTQYAFYGYGYWTVQLRESAGNQTIRPKSGQSGGPAAARAERIIGRCGLKDFEGDKEDGAVLLKMWSPACTDAANGRELFQLELGYLVAKDCRRQGYALEMGRAVLGYAFETLGADVVWVRICPENLASLALANKLGFY